MAGMYAVPGSEGEGAMSGADTLALASTNVEKPLGVKTPDALQSDLVATLDSDLLDFSKVVAVVSLRRGVVDIIECMCKNIPSMQSDGFLPPSSQAT